MREELTQLADRGATYGDLLRRLGEDRRLTLEQYGELGLVAYALVIRKQRPLPVMGNGSEPAP